MEIYKTLNLYPKYSISTFGNMKDIETNKIATWSICKLEKAPLVDKTGQIKNIPIHRMVAETFIENPDNLKYVEHIDCNKLNNNIDNLRWTTLKKIFANKPPRTNTGFAGVSYIKKIEGYRASFVDGQGKHCTKTYKCDTYPNAKELAIVWRKNKETES